MDTPLRRVARLAPLLLLAACATSPRDPSHSRSIDRPLPTAGEAVRVHEAFLTPPLPALEIDSVAAWVAPDGAPWLISTAKDTHQLVVHDGDTGAFVRTVGTRGAAPGEFDRPNGIAVFADRVFVVERDNRRVQVLALPGFEPTGSFGHAELRSPYGLWINEIAPGELEVYVTDNFMYGERYDVVPPAAELDQRVRRYRVRHDADGRLHSRYAGSFGDTGADALHVVESIAGDPSRQRLLIADERFLTADGGIASTLREYRFDGRATGKSLPHDMFAAEAEGVALWACSAETGYWLAVDQLEPRTVFHLFERDSLRPAGSFRGETTAFTDGVVVHAASTPTFPHGALFAVHADSAVAAFDLQLIARGLGLAPECGG